MICDHFLQETILKIPKCTETLKTKRNCSMTSARKGGSHAVAWQSGVRISLSTQRVGLVRATPVSAGSGVSGSTAVPRSAQREWGCRSSRASAARRVVEAGPD